MSTFTDSSALVKLYADEFGHDAIRSLRAMVISQLARVEVPAALWRKQRLGEISAGDAQVLTAEFESDFYGIDRDPRFAALTVTAKLLDGAARLCTVQGLRAYDAVQLSSALTARGADPGCSSFAAFDESLRVAAAAEGFTLIPVVAAR